MQLNGSSRSAVYWLLIAVSTGGMIGRILSVDTVDRRAELRSPALSANDRSRWCTIRSLVEYGTYEIDDILFPPETDSSGNIVGPQPTGAKDDPFPRRDVRWFSIDVVRHPNRDGELRFYSSKPPLLATLLAGEYWLIYQITGATLDDHPHEIVRLMLITINVLPLIVMFVLLGRLVERFGTTDWGRLFVMAAATFGTLVTTFAVTLNNHLPAAVSATIALYAAVRIWDGERRLWYFALAGGFAAFTATCELPALAFFAALGAALLWRAPRLALIAFAPAALAITAVFFGTNKLAHDRWSPPYAQRDEHNPAENWYDYEWYEVSGKHVDFRESEWRTHRKQGVDRGEPSRLGYAFHALVGHHGIFSLSPIWLLSLVGVWLAWRSSSYSLRSGQAVPCSDDSPASDGESNTEPLSAKQPLSAPTVAGELPQPNRTTLRDATILIASVTFVCLTFYLLRPLADRNYGGVSSGFRWMFWFTPFWLVTMLPAADCLSLSRRWRIVALVLLGLSVLSASYPTWNPWTHPWLFDYLGYDAK